MEQGGVKHLMLLFISKDLKKKSLSSSQRVFHRVSLKSVTASEKLIKKEITPKGGDTIMERNFSPVCCGVKEVVFTTLNSHFMILFYCN